MQSLLVENLPAKTTVPDLVDLFKPFGWVASVAPHPGPGGAVWEVDLAWGGDVAVRHLHGSDFRGRVLVVRGAHAHAESSPVSPPPPSPV